MALPVLQVNPVVGEMAGRQGAFIGESLARLGQQISKNLEDKAIVEEARAAAPMLDATYRTAFSLIESGDTAGGYSALLGAATKFSSNPILAKINDSAIRAGIGMSDAYLRKAVAEMRAQSSGSSGLPVEQVDAQFDGPGGQVDVQETDMPADPEGLIPGTVPAMSSKAPAGTMESETARLGPQVNQATKSGQFPTDQQPLRQPVQKVDPAEAYNTDGVNKDDFNTFEVKEEFRPFLGGASEIGLPVKSTESVSDTKSVSSKGTYSRSQTRTKSDPKVDEETKKNFQSVNNALGVLASSAGIKEAMKATGGDFTKLQRAPQRGGLRESNAITWEGNAGKPIEISDSEMRAFEGIKAFPQNAATAGVKLFGVGGNKSGKKISKELAQALRSNPNDDNARRMIAQMYGPENVDMVVKTIVGR